MAARTSRTSRSAEEVARLRDMAQYLSDLANAIPEQAEMLWRMARKIEDDLARSEEGGSSSNVS